MPNSQYMERVSSILCTVEEVVKTYGKSSSYYPSVSTYEYRLVYAICYIHVLYFTREKFGQAL
jgi:hypothetical protein